MYKVNVKLAEEDFEYYCQSTEDTLSAARKTFIPLPSGCRRGGCGMCKVKVVEGNYKHNPIRSKEALSDEEMDNRYALACMVYPSSDLKIVVGEDEPQIKKTRQEQPKMKKQGSYKTNIYMKPVLTLEVSNKIVEAVCKKAKELDILVNVAIVDDGTNLKQFARMDESPLLSGEIAQNKAYTAASFGIATHEWYSLIKDDPALLHGIVHTDRLVVFGGGIPLKYNDKILGGIGVSGGSAEQDIQCAKAGLRVFEMLIHSSSVNT